MCTRCYARDPARRCACARCGTLAPVAYRVDGQPLCQKCGPHKLYTCSSCGRENRQAHAITATGPICSICYRRSRKHECVQCGRITAQARLADHDGGTWICNRCWTPPPTGAAAAGSCGRAPRAAHRAAPSVRHAVRGSADPAPVLCVRAPLPSRPLCPSERCAGRAIGDFDAIRAHVSTVVKLARLSVPMKPVVGSVVRVAVMTEIGSAQAAGELIC